MRFLWVKKWFTVNYVMRKFTAFRPTWTVSKTAKGVFYVCWFSSSNFHETHCFQTFFRPVVFSFNQCWETHYRARDQGFLVVCLSRIGDDSVFNVKQITNPQTSTYITEYSNFHENGCFRTPFSVRNIDFQSVFKKPTIEQQIWTLLWYVYYPTIPRNCEVISSNVK